MQMQMQMQMINYDRCLQYRNCAPRYIDKIGFTFLYIHWFRSSYNTICLAMLILPYHYNAINPCNTSHTSGKVPRRGSFGIRYIVCDGIYSGSSNRRTFSLVCVQTQTLYVMFKTQIIVKPYPIGYLTRGHFVLQIHT